MNRSRNPGPVDAYPVDAYPEHLDVATRVPKTKEECEHYARYLWASTVVRGEALDIACGTGYGARLLARHARVTGIDRDEDVIDKARARVTGRFLTAAVPPIPLPDETFDFVVCFETVEHIADDLEFVREIRRVLHPGGELLISTPNKDISAPSGVPLNKWHVREYALASLEELLKNAGLEVGDVYAQSFPPKLKRAHRVMWRLHGLTWTQPAVVRSVTRSLFGDAEVRPFDSHRPAPGYWLVRARREKNYV